MSRIASKFEELRKKGEKALVVYITAGHPDMETTCRLIPALAEAGVDILEVGVPFSDPTADGPVIQASSQEAIRKGASLEAILEMLRDLRKVTSLPFVLFSYYNPLFVAGPGRFARRASEAGVDGLLVVDLPREEAGELRRHTDGRGLDFIPLVAPTTGEERMRAILEDASGFVYYITMTGVTGTGRPAEEEAREKLRRIKELTPLPVVAGFGISTPDQAARLAPFADGVVVGSALVSLIDKTRLRGDLLAEVCRFTRSLKAALGPVP
ncbi:MAG TPA: tryptophan synthase subunit alpha [Syntrophales bacterium]|nr:tryptophan synthase subunit alpha [Syntrophales bacterium]HOM07575.1 tryptophan synthase subunit alpha [Syntrophales bacterium]HOO00220.1 tryptophan synthase subunit alpha [Syntrophales bacterium]HPC01565.1 tryptophan synthase subunit alpha [Syntrophales bacterium]HPQ07185.1 tryptophan synthase subunit alpha [Syntrophales bacterium]